MNQVVRWGSMLDSRREPREWVHRLRARNNTSSEQNNIVLSDKTLEKYFGIGTHAGGPYPQTDSAEATENAESTK